jgi:hypothetical protein
MNADRGVRPGGSGDVRIPGNVFCLPATETDRRFTADAAGEVVRLGQALHLAAANRAITDLKIGTRAVPYALAAACTPQELEKGAAGISAEDYRRMRAELADLFGLASADFTMENLQSRQFNQHHPTPENVYAGSGGGH